MILVHSRPTDTTTVKTIEWIVNFYKEKILRISSIFDIVSYLSIDFEDKSRFNLFTGYYFHGGSPMFKPINFFKSDTKYLTLDAQLSKRIFNDLITIINSKFENENNNIIFGINPFKPYENLKLKSLKLAKSVGLAIPETQILNDKQSLIQFLEKHKSIISKSITEGVNIRNDFFHIDGERTIMVTEKCIDNVPSIFLPTMFQKFIKKEFEIRVFFYKSLFYSIAIFTYGEKSQIDNRILDINFQNRNVPFDLPQKIKNQIINLMDKLKLNYGSIDMIYGENEEFYFLEVNEYGQYGFVSSSGNFQLEKIIAQTLINGQEKKYKQNDV